jgi:hypothetical protein
LTTEGPAPPTGDSGLRGERPPTPPPPLLLLPLLSFSGGGVDRGGISPEAARVGRTQGAAARLLIGKARTGHVDGGDAVAARGARRDDGHARRGPRFGLRHQQKGKREDDDDDITATSVWDPAVNGSRAAHGWWRQRGR